MNKPETPTLDRRSAVIEESNAIGRFLDWVSEQGIHLAKWVDGEGSWRSNGTDAWEDIPRILEPIHEGPSALLHRYYNIDPNEEEKELRAVLEYTRSLNAVPDYDAPAGAGDSVEAYRG